MLGLQHIFVDAEHDSCIGIAARRGDQHTLGAGFDVLGSGSTLGEQTGAFHHQVDVQAGPRQLGRVTLGQDADLVVTDEQILFVVRDSLGETAVDGIAAQQVSIELRITQIIDSDDLDTIVVLTFIQRTQHVATDATKTIDGDA